MFQDLPGGGAHLMNGHLGVRHAILWQAMYWRAGNGWAAQEIGGMSGAQEHGEAAMVRHRRVEASAMRAEPG
ncbi:MAG: hypothetical protein JO357_05350 [Hyphomicrobiales bacterium]|nr:hypothetical protein [Hyphomicrobiales bacterium]MBV9052217.1 hypothetical protein [Hyphomicrobiales bacterium]MBV9136463.1 hypothetical protein [Hyphomicrobiales bacterium]MBV9975522.1 hypothetical protein [Hyphomicrobiales bacterium]